MNLVQKQIKKMSQMINPIKQNLLILIPSKMLIHPSLLTLRDQINRVFMNFKPTKTIMINAKNAI